MPMGSTTGQGGKALLERNQKERECDCRCERVHEEEVMDDDCLEITKYHTFFHLNMGLLYILYTLLFALSRCIWLLKFDGFQVNKFLI